MDATVGSIQLVAELQPWSWAKGEFVYEYDSEFNSHKLDEAIGTLDIGDFELEFGDYFMPFGEYLSHFVSSPDY